MQCAISGEIQTLAADLRLRDKRTFPPFRPRIPLEEISAVRESNSVRSGPALSMDRLEIACSNGRVLLISPGDKAGFLAALRRRAPQLPS